MVRVIAGTAGGLKLKTIDSDRTKPTLDRVKESMFSILSPFIAGRDVLDLFAGSGALGIEALSRGAAYCCFNDRDRKCGETVRYNIDRAGMTDRAEISCGNYRHALGEYAAKNRQFGLILLDPPYGSGFYEDALGDVLRYGLFTPDCVIMCEHGREAVLPETFGGFAVWKCRNYGTVGLTFYRLCGDGGQTSGEI